MRAQLITWLKNDITPEVRKSRKPEAELLKFARAQNLPPAQLEALAQLYNTAATVAYLEKHAGADRGNSFPIVEVPDLVTDYLKVRTEPVKQAAPAGMTLRWENTGVINQNPTLPACFASFSSLPAHWNNAPDEVFLLKAASGEPQLSEKELWQRRLELKSMIEQAKQATFNLTEDLRHELDGVRMLFRTSEPPAFDQQESDALHLLGESAKQACDVAAKWLQDSNITVKRASGAGTRRLVQKTPLITKLAAINAILKVRKDIQTEVDRLEKQAIAPKGQPSGGSGGSSGSSSDPGKDLEDRTKQEQRDKETGAFNLNNFPDRRAPKNLSRMSAGLPGEGMGALSKDNWLMKDGPEAVSNAINSVSGNADKWLSDKDSLIGKLFKDRFEDVLNERGNPGQQVVDRGLTNARRQAMLQQLLVTDEVLSEADPEHVVSLYNTLVQTMPELAGDSNVMRMALRSAVQHDGISPFDIKQMTDTDNARTQQTMNRKVLDAVDYKGAPVVDKPKLKK